MVHPGGRPRYTTPPKEECIRLGKDLLEWAQVEDKEDPRTRFTQWYCLKHSLLKNEWKALILLPEFVPYYQKARVYLARRCLDGTLEKSFGHRYIRLYDKDLADEEDDLVHLKREVSRKAERESLFDVIRHLAKLEEDSNGIPSTEETQ